MNLCVPADHPALPGHFPGQPIVPGVVILDFVQRALEDQSGTSAVRLKIGQVKFLQPLLPDQTATLDFERKGDGFAFRVQREGTVLVSGDMVLA